MNAFVRSLGCASTVFVNPHGLDGVGAGARDQRSCAGDIARVAAIAVSHALFLSVVRAKAHRAIVWRARGAAAQARAVPPRRDAGGSEALHATLTPLAAAAAAAVAAAEAVDADAAEAMHAAGVLSDAMSDRSQARARPLLPPPLAPSGRPVAR